MTAPAGRSEADRVTVQVDNGVATVLLSNAPRRNALTERMLRQLERVLDDLAFDDEVHIVVVRGAGLDFSAGIDVETISWMRALSAPATRHVIRNWQRVFERVEDLEKPVIAAMHGAAVGGALEFAATCDFRVAETSTMMSLPEIRLGTHPDGGMQRIARHIGLGRAKDLVMTGRRFDAVEAARVGLVDRLADAGQLDAAVDSLIDELRTSAPEALGLAKRVLVRGSGGDLRLASELELLATGALYGGSAMEEGLRAFRARDTPRFR